MWNQNMEPPENVKYASLKSEIDESEDFLRQILFTNETFFTLMSALIVTAVESVEQAEQPHWMRENVCDTAKVYECFYEEVIIEGIIYRAS